MRRRPQYRSVRSIWLEDLRRDRTRNRVRRFGQALVLAHGLAPELPAPEHERLVEQPALLEIGQRIHISAGHGLPEAEALRLLDRLKELEAEGQRVRGLFSTSQIGKQLGRDVTETMRPAHSLAEIVHESI